MSGAADSEANHAAGGGTKDAAGGAGVITAAVLAIGDELLSGRTKDRNIGYIADYLTAIGINLREARMVPDDEAMIVAALNALRPAYDYVFTTGGIGPTHDDITADCVARAFGVGIDHDPRAVAMLEEHFKATGYAMNEARMRMARIPDGADLIVNTVSKAPGFRLGNVFVMAGVPTIMQAMLDEIAPLLKTGRVIHSRTVECARAEGELAGPLGEIQKRFPDVAMGSYPFFRAGGPGSNLVLRSRDEALLEEATAAVRAMVSDLLSRTGG